MIEQDPRITEGPTFFQSLYGWMKRVAATVNANETTLGGKVNRSGDTMTGGLNLVSPSTSATEASSDNSTRIATTAWCKFGFAILLSTVGYIKFPAWLGGLIIQWGRTNVTFDAFGTGVITYPLAFPTANFCQMAQMSTSYTSAQQLTCYVDWTAAGLTTFAIYAQVQTGGGAVSNYTGSGANANWVSIGN